MNPSQTAPSPAPPQAQLAPTSKPTAGAAGNNSPFSSPQLYYEPTSVLEPHHLDSSPPSDQLAADANNGGGGGGGGGGVCWDQKPPKYALAPPAPTAFVVPSADDWDPLTCWLLDKDAIGPGELDYDGEVHHPAATPQYHQFPFDNNADPFDFLAPPYGSAAASDQQQHLGPFGPSQLPLLQPTAPPPTPPPAFEQAHLEQLLRAAHAAEAGDRAGACAILARLNHHLPSPAGRPFQRAAFYFKDALHSLLLLDDNHHNQQLHQYQLGGGGGGSSPVDVVRRIAAYKALCDLSPVPQFAAFTTNQTVIDTLGARPLHVVDFDIGLGGQWASFTHEYALRCCLPHTSPPTLRITAVVHEETLETRLVGENLRNFAASLGVRLAFDVVATRDSGAAALGGVRLTAGESLAVIFSPSVSRLLGNRGPEPFVRFLRRASPKVTVFVDAESGSYPMPPAMQPYQHSFRGSFIAGLQYYSVVLESLDAAASTGCGAAMAENVRRIERALVQPRVREAVRSYVARPVRWREMLQAAGLRPLAFSDHAVTQAECLTQGFPVGGYRVAKSDGALVLIWRDMEIAATSAWQC